MKRIIFELPAQKPGTALWDVPDDIEHPTTDNAPVGFMLGFSSNPNYEEYDINKYFPKPEPAKFLFFLTGRQLTKLLGMDANEAIRLAVPTDKVARYFIDMGEQINASAHEEKIWVGHIDFIACMNHFLQAKYIDKPKHAEVLQGYPNESN